MHHVGTPEEFSADRKRVKREKPITWLLGYEGVGRPLLSPDGWVVLGTIRVCFDIRNDNLKELIDVELLLLPLEIGLSLGAIEGGLRCDKNFLVLVFGDRSQHLVNFKKESLVDRRALRVLEELPCVLHSGLQVKELLESVVEEDDLPR